MVSMASFSRLRAMRSWSLILEPANLPILVQVTLNSGPTIVQRSVLRMRWCWFMRESWSRRRSCRIAICLLEDRAINESMRKPWQAPCCQRAHICGAHTDRHHLKKTRLKRLPCNHLSLQLSGWLDSNQRPHAPQTRTLTGLSYTPNCGCKGKALF